MIEIELDRANGQFRPGDPISGTVRWSELAVTETHLEIRLIWYTAGKATTDVEVEDVVRVDPVDTSGRFAFQMQAPTRPYSFSGKLISLVWCIEVIPFPGKNAQQRELTISPTGQEIELTKSFDQSKLKRSGVQVSWNR